MDLEEYFGCDEQAFVSVISEPPLVFPVVSDLCATGDHDCEQVCVSSPGSYTCACHEGFTLNSDGKTCNGQWMDLGKPWGGRWETVLVASQDVHSRHCVLCFWTDLQNRQMLSKAS